MTEDDKRNHHQTTYDNMTLKHRCCECLDAGRPYLETMMEVLNQACFGLPMLFIPPIGEVKRAFL